MDFRSPNQSLRLAIASRRSPLTRFRPRALVAGNEVEVLADFTGDSGEHFSVVRMLSPSPETWPLQVVIKSAVQQISAR